MKIINIKDSQLRFEKVSKWIVVIVLGVVTFTYTYINEIYAKNIELPTTELSIQQNDEIPTQTKRVDILESKPKLSIKVGKRIEPVEKRDNELQDILDGWKGVKTASSNRKISFVYQESKERGLNPKVVIAVMAKESGWLTSEYCTKKGNCFGYGYTDSGKVGNYEGEFKKVTEKILDMYKKQGYGQSAESMAKRGYNFYPEWIVGVNIIKGYFN